MSNQNPTTHQYRGTPVSLICTPINNGKGYWDSCKVEILFSGKKIGEYIRHYPHFVTETFHPFLYEGGWFALYSADYTATRVVKLSPDNFEDWCGEEGDSMGFCPTAFYVPKYKVTKERFQDDWLTITFFDNEFSKDEEEEYHSIEKELSKDPEVARYEGEHYCNYGFLSGCIWGDDSSWKLRFIDFSQLNEKVLKIEEKFGYFELPHNLKLKECIKNDSEGYFELVQLRRFNFKHGLWEANS